MTRRVVGSQDVELVPRSERSPASPLGHLRVGTGWIGSATRPGSARAGVVSSTVTVTSASLHPRPQVSDCWGAGASPQVGREGRSAYTHPTADHTRHQAVRRAEPAAVTEPIV